MINTNKRNIKYDGDDDDDDDDDDEELRSYYMFHSSSFLYFVKNTSQLSANLW